MVKIMSSLVRGWPFDQTSPSLIFMVWMRPSFSSVWFVMRSVSGVYMSALMSWSTGLLEMTGFMAMGCPTTPSR